MLPLLQFRRGRILRTKEQRVQGFREAALHRIIGRMAHTDLIDHGRASPFLFNPFSSTRIPSYSNGDGEGYNLLVGPIIEL